MTPIRPALIADCDAIGAVHVAAWRETYRGLLPDRLRWSGPLLRSPEALWRGLVQPAAVERWVAGDVRDDSDRVGLLQCLFAELWRFTRAGGELEALAAGG